MVSLSQNKVNSSGIFGETPSINVGLYNVGKGISSERLSERVRIINRLCHKDVSSRVDLGGIGRLLEVVLLVNSIPRRVSNVVGKVLNNSLRLIVCVE